MSKEAAPNQGTLDPEPRWPALLAMLAVGGLYFALPEPLSPGPNWLVMVVVLALLTPAFVLHHLRWHATAQLLYYFGLGAVTLAMIGSLVLLVWRLPAHAETPKQLLISAASLWISNLLIFASWYWRLD